MHVQTKEKLAQIVSRFKPDFKNFFYGFLMAEKSVVSLIKNDPTITIIPAGNLPPNPLLDISLLLNYILTNDDYLQTSSPVFTTLCLPGMSESFKLHIYIYVEEESNLRFVYVCDDNS